MGEDGFVVELALIGVLILLNGFFAGAEIAVVSARTARLRGRMAGTSAGCSCRTSIMIISPMYPREQLAMDTVAEPGRKLNVGSCFPYEHLPTN